VAALPAPRLALVFRRPVWLLPVPRSPLVPGWAVWEWASAAVQGGWGLPEQFGSGQDPLMRKALLHPMEWLRAVSLRLPLHML